jgi:MarR family 2-MHQ and catechol resistance regulon transcriptional repressor
MTTTSSHRLSEQFLEAAQVLLRALQLRDRACCADHGLSPTQWHTVRMLLDEGAQPMHALAERLRVTRSTATRVVDLLEKKGLVRRRSAPRDRRSLQVGLTRHGEEVCRELLSSLEHASAQMLLRLRPSEREACVRSLEQLARAAGRWSDSYLPVDALRSLRPEDGEVNWFNE